MKESKSLILKKRLSQLREPKYLSIRIFQRISENMHYEIFKYLTPEDLLEIKESGTGGYQLTSNKLLRSRIANYFPHLILYLDFNTESDIWINIRRIILAFENMGNVELGFRGLDIGDQGVIELVSILEIMADGLGTIYIYIYI